MAGLQPRATAGAAVPGFPAALWLIPGVSG